MNKQDEEEFDKKFPFTYDLSSSGGRTELKEYITSLINEQEEDDWTTHKLLFDRFEDWQKEWQEEKPKERALTHHDLKKLIEWKIDKLLSEQNEKIIQWAKRYVERDMKTYGTDKHGVSLEDLIDYLKN